MNARLATRRSRATLVMVGLGLTLVAAPPGSPAPRGAPSSARAENPAFEELVDDDLAAFHDVGGDIGPVNDGSAAFCAERPETAREKKEGRVSGAGARPSSVFRFHR